jgi:glycosyltransferase involved in cell wall biosynthesis
MKKIGIDARLYFQTGVGVYIRNLLYYLSNINNKHVIYYIYILKGDKENIKLPKNFIIRPVTSKWHTISEQTIFLKEILKDRLDLMHFTYFSFPILYPKKFIATVHDTTLLHHKTGKASTKSPFLYNIKYIFFKYVFLKQIKKADIILTPTKTVKADIINLFGQDCSDKIHITYEGVTHEFLNRKLIKKDNKQIKFNYLLYIGNFFPHKNVESLIKAFLKLKTPLKLLLIGPDDYFSKRIRELIINKNAGEKIILLKNVKINDLPYYYKNAKAFIHASFSEGFGLPLIEAYHFKCPILASNISTFKEILKDSYISFNPYDVLDIKQKIEEFLKNPKNNYNHLIMSRFSFKNMVFKTYSIYCKALNLSI